MRSGETAANREKESSMAKANPVRFQLASRQIGADGTGEAATQVQRYLRRYGYLRSEAEPGKLDRATREALRRFQERATVPPTAVLDEPNNAA